jgi:hypothetical protein
MLLLQFLLFLCVSIHSLRLMHGAGVVRVPMNNLIHFLENFSDQKWCFNCGSWTYRLPSQIDFRKVTLVWRLPDFCDAFLTLNCQVFLFRSMSFRN